jgi:hypothetical protein
MYVLNRGKVALVVNKVPGHEDIKGNAVRKFMENIQGDSKLLSVFPWPISFKPEGTK